MSLIGNMSYAQRCHLFRSDIFFLNFSRIKLSSSQIIDFGFDIFNTKSYNLTYQLRYENYEKKEKQELLLLLPSDIG